ncbi:MAG TPA: hypothetical protein VN760_10860 [Casimicrobiaceae bacterium]|nr:hypothetical protein [Casimicrobiaceae bacterium]
MRAPDPLHALKRHNRVVLIVIALAQRARRSERQNARPVQEQEAA